MTEGGGFWQEGQRAWARLAAWRSGTSRARSDEPDQGDHALQALSDVGLLRRVLDQIEFDAIRTNRRQGKSWAEIAVRLGITRQSAWERWQDIDQPARPQSNTRAGDPSTDPPPSSGQIIAEVARRDFSFVQVPNVVGMTWDDARVVLLQARLTGVGPDPDGPPLARSSSTVVIDQSPESGATVRPGTAVTLWLDEGGGSGVREPRRPTPDPKVGRKMRAEATDEAVG